MKHSLLRYSVIFLLVGLVDSAADRANAQVRPRDEIIIESLSWGMSSGQTARISLVNLVDGSVTSRDPILARIQLLDTEGELIAQSNEISVEPGKTRSWDVPRELLPAGEPTGRIQLRARMLITTTSFDVNRPRPRLAPTIELIDASTGETVLVLPEGVVVDFGRP